MKTSEIVHQMRESTARKASRYRSASVVERGHGFDRFKALREFYANANFEILAAGKAQWGIDRNLRGKPRGSARGSSEQAGTACGATSVASGRLACEVQQGQPHQPFPHIRQRLQIKRRRQQGKKVRERNSKSP